MAADVEELVCSQQEEKCTCLLWRKRRIHLAQHIPVPNPHSRLELDKATQRAQKAHDERASAPCISNLETEAPEPAIHILVLGFTPAVPNAALYASSDGLSASFRTVPALLYACITLHLVTTTLCDLLNAGVLRLERSCSGC